MATPLSTAQASLIMTALRQVGTDAGLAAPLGVINSNLGTLWVMYEDKGRLSLRLQFLYTKRDAIDLMRLQVAGLTDFGEAGVTQSDDQIFKNLSDLRAEVMADITALETQIRGGGQAAIGALTQTQPVMPCPLGPDPNDSRYKGDALKRPFGPRW